METHNIINISSINIMKWLIFLKLFVTMEDMNDKCLIVDIILKQTDL